MFCFTENIEDVYPMMGSKYLQAEIGNAYKDAERFLKEGRKVLFTGCPCQLAGLHRFLQREYDNLISVDCLCHGVPSPGVWHRYLDEIFFSSTCKATDDEEAVLPSIPVISGIEFRNKTISGWKKYHFVVYGKANFNDDSDSVLLSLNNNDNPYMKGFLSNVFLRPSCHACKCKNGRSRSDITIGDYWGIENKMPDFYDDMGVSLIIINTPKGLSYFNRLNMETRVSSVEDAICFNSGLKEQQKENSKRELFFRLYNNGVSIHKAIDACLYQPIHIRAIMTIKSYLRRTAKNLLGKEMWKS